jgi:hypothetical protein
LALCALACSTRSIPKPPTTNTGEPCFSPFVPPFSFIYYGKEKKKKREKKIYAPVILDMLSYTFLLAYLVAFAAAQRGEGGTSIARCRRRGGHE